VVAVPSVLTIKLSKNTLQSMDCGALNNLIGFFQWACEVRGDQTSCKQLDYLRAIASSKGCTI